MNRTEITQQAKFYSQLYSEEDIPVLKKMLNSSFKRLDGKVFDNGGPTSKSLMYGSKNVQHRGYEKI